jgi:hypothetical protein
MLKTYKIFKVTSKWEDGEYVHTKIISLLDTKFKIKYYSFSSAMRYGGEILIKNMDDFKLFHYKSNGFQSPKCVIKLEEYLEFLKNANNVFKQIDINTFIDFILFLTSKDIKYLY